MWIFVAIMALAIVIGTSMVLGATWLGRNRRSRKRL